MPCALPLLSLACSQATIGDQGGADGGLPPADAALSDPADAAVAPPDAEPGPDIDGALQSVTLQAGDNSIAPQNSVSCNNNSPDFQHSDNHYYRTYDLAAAGISTDFVVSSVDIGIEEALSTTGTQPLIITLHTLTGPFLLANLTQLETVSLDLADQSATTLNVPITTTAPAGSTLVIEAFSPDGQTLGNRFFIGSNALPEAFPSYIVASACNITEPTETSQLGIDGLIMSVVMNVTGDHTSP